MRRRKTGVLIATVLFCCFISSSLPQAPDSHTTDTTQIHQVIYDPFGPENSPDHNGRGSGGVLTPSPYESIIQSNYTKISADYTGIQFMLDSPLQISPGLSWSTYKSNLFGILFKVRSSGFRSMHYDQVLDDTVPRYHLPFEISFDYSLDEKSFPAFKFCTNWESYTKSLGMAGIGVIISKLNLAIAHDEAMDRKWDVELSYIQVAGGYIMPLSPEVGGVNVAACGAVDLLGIKYQVYNSDRNKFYGAKIGSAGWLAGFGWNALSVFNLSFYIGGEWSFSTGVLELPTKKFVRADIGRNTIYFGTQITGRYFNVVGGIQKEWEYRDYPSNVKSEKNLRYYTGINYYLSR